MTSSAVGMCPFGGKTTVLFGVVTIPMLTSSFRRKGPTRTVLTIIPLRLRVTPCMYDKDSAPSDSNKLCAKALQTRLQFSRKNNSGLAESSCCTPLEHSIFLCSVVSTWFNTASKLST